MPYSPVFFSIYIENGVSKLSKMLKFKSFSGANSALSDFWVLKETGSWLHGFIFGPWVYVLALSLLLPLFPLLLF